LVTLGHLGRATLALLLLAAGGWAQTTNATDGTTPPGLAPGAPAGSYSLTGFENVNLYSGNLNFHLPLIKVGGRGGAQAGSYLSIDSLRWTVNKSGGNDATPEVVPCGGEDLQCSHEAVNQKAYNSWDSADPDPNWWQGLKVGYGPGVMHGRRQKYKGVYNNTQNYTFLTRLTFTASGGTEYELRDVKESGNPRYLPAGQDLSRGTVFVSADGASATFVSDVEIFEKQGNAWMDDGASLTYPTGYLLLADGTRYRVEQGLVRWLRDRNGNRVSFLYDAFSRVAKVTDSLGREVNYAYDVQDAAPYGLCDRITFSGFGGAQRVVRVSKSYLGAALRPDHSLRKYGGPSGLFPELTGSSTTDFTTQVATAVWLPDGAQRYRLFYNSYAELARVVLPTGGVIEYDYTPGSGVDEQRLEIHRRVVERRVYRDASALAAGQVELRQSYQVSYPGGAQTLVVAEQRGGDGALVERTRHHFQGSAPAYQPPSAFYPPWDSGREGVTEALDVSAADHAGAAVLRRTVNTWQPGTPLSQWATNPEAVGGPYVSRTETTLGETGQVGKQVFKYDRYNNRTDAWEFDYGDAHAARHTHTDFLTVNNGVDYTSHAGAHLRTLPSAQQVYSVEPSTGAETLAARSETRYDEAAYPLLPCDPDGVVACASVPQWSDPGTAARGNATTSRRWVNTNNTWVETHARYDRLGNLRQRWDANGNLFEVTFKDSFCNGSLCGPAGYTANTFGFATGSKSPKPDPAGARGAAAELTSSTVFDYYTGRAYSTTEANGNTTRFEYDDPLDRLTAQVRPDGGRTNIYYSRPDEPYIYTRTLADLDGGRRLKSEQHFDGLSRPARSFVWENQDAGKPWLTTDTLYDALGRERKVSDTYRSAGPGSAVDAQRPGTETAFDSLGRVTQVRTTADNALVKKTYGGQSALITDQAGRQRVSKTDAFGRLVEVWEVTPNDPARYPGSEPIPSPLPQGMATPAHGYRTGYEYDALGNLWRVTQGAQTRTFVYDSLSRLISTTNPESGKVDYVYDANSNLLTRTDARGTVASHVYDSLNRNVGITYTPGGAAAATPAVTRFYDNPAAGANGLGRLWRSEAAQTAQTVVDKYDAAGRPTQHAQKFWAAGQWGPAYTTRADYNLAGGVTSIVYPSNNWVGYQYDAAGRLGDEGGLPAFRGTLGGGAAAKTYASHVAYGELGGMSQERFGTDTPVYNKRFFNPRGQLSEVRVSTHPNTGADPALRTNWNRGAIINHYSDQSWAGSGTDNNGNLRKQDVYVPDDDAISGYGLSTFFYDYDAINRLSRVRESRGGADHWSQQYGYDRWGNRTLDAAGTWVDDPSAAPSSLVGEAQFDKSELPNSNRLQAPGDSSLAPSQRRIRYDPAGNLTYDGFTGGGERVYDAENRMTGAQFVAGQTQTARYSYDADGRRVRRGLGAGGEVWQVYGPGGELLAEYTPGASPAQPLREYGYRAGELLVTAEAAAPRGNVALAAAGATATARSHTPDGVFAGLHFQPAYVNDGVRYVSPQGDQYWRDEHGLPTWLQVDFGEQKTIDEVDVFTLANYPAYTAQTDPTAAQTFTQYGVTSFEVQYWTGSAWAAVPGGSVSGNNLVWKKLTFPAVTTGKIRVMVGGATDGVARVTEVEAWGTAATRVNAALASRGGQASASSTTPDTEFPGLTFPVGSVNDGDRKGAGWEHGGGWRDGTNNAYPDWAQVEFSGAKTIDEVDVFTVQDAINNPSEPTEAMAFAQYGVTSFDVQYWTGSAWATVPGGAVTGNNKVWRRLTFPAVTTSKVRVVVNGAQAGRSRLVEIEAWGWGAGPGNGPAVRWLVKDQVGTPRIILDQTGSLVGVSRHDYLPFGEEVAGDSAWRTPARGYAGDAVREKFTSYERDAETGLDYAKARYYSPSMGRFTAVDPLLASAKPADPQTWNRYTYVLNRPTIAIDPDGLSVIVVVVSPRMSGGDGSASVGVYNRDGQGVPVRNGSNRIEGRAVGASGPERNVRNGDSPFGVYRSLPNYNGSNANGTQGGTAGESARGRDTRYGTGIITMEPVSGEVVNSGRSSIYIHGGGRPLDRSLEDQQPLTPTQGCVRVHNEDVNALIGVVNAQAATGDPVVNIFIGDVPTLNGIADQRDPETGSYLYTELRNAGFGSPDTQGRPPGSVGHENANAPPRRR
jgi:RHS repeat-associated protein